MAENYSTLKQMNSGPYQIGSVMSNMQNGYISDGWENGLPRGNFSRIENYLVLLKEKDGDMCNRKRGAETLKRWH